MMTLFLNSCAMMSSAREVLSRNLKHRKDTLGPWQPCCHRKEGLGSGWEALGCPDTEQRSLSFVTT